MNTIKHWFMKHFYQDIYNLYRQLEEQQEINTILADRIQKLEEKANV